MPVTELRIGFVHIASSEAVLVVLRYMQTKSHHLADSVLILRLGLIRVRLWVADMFDL